MADSLGEFYRHAVVGALAGPERLVALSGVVMADPGVTEPVSVRDEVANLFDPTLWLGLGAHPGDLLRLLTWRRAVQGGTGSIAAQVHQACGRPGGWRAMVVTDARLLVGQLVELPDRGRGTTGRLLSSRPSTGRPRSRATTVGTWTARRVAGCPGRFGRARQRGGSGSSLR